MSFAGAYSVEVISQVFVAFRHFLTPIADKLGALGATTGTFVFA